MSYDGKKFPFDAASFDVALAICVLHHVSLAERAVFLEEMKRILKPGGLGIIFEHNSYNPLTRHVVSVNPLDEGAVLLSRSNLEKLIRQSKFSQPKSQFVLFTPFERPVFRKLDRALGWCPFGAQYYTVGVNE